MNGSNNHRTAAIFDMDGTLAKTDVFHRRSWQDYLAERGAFVSDADYYGHIAGRPGKNVLPELLDLSPEDSEAVVSTIEARYWELASGNMRPLEGLRQFLRLIQGWPKALATSARATSARRTLRELGLEAELDALVTAEDVSRGKPDPQVFLLAAREVGVEPERCLAFEDSVSGLAAARAAGMYCIGVATSHSPEELSAPRAGAHLTIEDFTDPRLAGLVSAPPESWRE